jgi:glyoxylase-like metal-dependent hydrolase (beta-lactamase superfamily II)
MNQTSASVHVPDDKVVFEEVGRGLYVYAVDDGPMSGAIVGDDGVLIVDAQPAPAIAADLIARMGRITDKPVRYLLLTHFHAAATLGASAFGAVEIVASDTTRELIAERGKQDAESASARYPRLFPGTGTLPALRRPSLTFPDQVSLWLGTREIRMLHVGRGHTAGDVIAAVPDCGAVFCGDLVANGHACDGSDAHFTDWPATLDNLAEMQPAILVSGRGAALTSSDGVRQAIEATADFVATLYASAQDSVAQGRSLKEAHDAARVAMDAKFGMLSGYEDDLPFGIARAYDEARGMDWPAVWTAERARESRAALTG